MSLSTCTASQASTRSLEVLCGKRTVTDSGDLDNMTGTFIELSRGRHPAECPCTDRTGLTQVDVPSLLDTMGSLRSCLPAPGKTMGWLVPGRSSLRSMASREIQIQGDQRFTVGREETCDLVLEEFMFDSVDGNLQCNKTSRVQFEITSEAERPFIMDRSMNGTFLNGEKLSQGVAKRLNHGDIISVLHEDLEMFCYQDEVQMTEKRSRPHQFTDESAYLAYYSPLHSTNPEILIYVNIAPDNPTTETLL